MKKYDVPFVSNTEDDLHCQQSAYAMIRDYFEPGRYNLTWDEWSSITGYEVDKGTWASSGLLWFGSKGYEVQHISLFDYPEFARIGADYLRKAYGDSVGDWQVAHSNLPREQALASELVDKGLVEFREPQFEDIKQAIDSGALCRCLVNSRVLAGKDGYFGHAIVISGYDEEGFIIQDPGLPPIPNRHVVYDLFEKAWAYPNIEAKELDIIKKDQ